MRQFIGARLMHVRPDPLLLAEHRCQLRNGFHFDSPGEIKLHKRSFASRIAVPLLIAATGLWSGSASAVPSFARQTGMACAACHTAFPELTAFGRQFKLDGYTFQSTPQVGGGDGKAPATVQISSIPPLSVMFQVSYTDTKGANAAQQGTRQNFDFPEQFSLFYAGEISPHLGAFLQVTHGDNSGGFAMDNSEIRYANHLDAAGGDLLLGVVANNNPSMSDVWQSTPVWGYPYAGPQSYEKPLSWGLGQSVGGAGAYVLYNATWYGELMLYKTMGSGGQDTPLTDPWTGLAQASIAGWAPYMRLAYQNSFGDNYVELGLFGMHTRMYGVANPVNGQGTSGPTDTFNDIAIDAQYERPIGDDSIIVHGVVAKEKIGLDAYRVANPGVPDATFRVVKLNGSYHLGANKTLSVGYVKTSGDAADAATYVNGLKTGTTATTLEGAYYPWENVRLSLQYTGYSKFLGATSSASDNNTTYLLAWFVF
jgi:hypothetical protein